VCNEDAVNLSVKICFFPDHKQCTRVRCSYDLFHVSLRATPLI